MCIGVPMIIVQREGIMALCEAELSDGVVRRESVDLTLLPDLQPGCYVLVFMGVARQELTAEEAERIRAALSAVALLTDPTTSHDVSSLLEKGFADLYETPPRLPPHLEAALAAGLKEA
ncbi:MAG: HypC/HybG/HupF family hydrogenase formation chaperone [Acetobacter sp.]|nr:HypC/HybG/HupF family hydrogenase formation chaperone [Acetobacter sp.]